MQNDHSLLQVGQQRAEGNVAAHKGMRLCPTAEHQGRPHQSLPRPYCQGLPGRRKLCLLFVNLDEPRSEMGMPAPSRVGNGSPWS